MNDKKRSSRIIMTNEARVLKQMRLKKGLSMRSAGLLINRSDSYIAHIEGGRMDLPRGDKFLELLKIYGNITPKSFREKVRHYIEKKSLKDELTELVNRLDHHKLEILQKLTLSLANEGHKAMAMYFGLEGVNKNEN